MGSQKMKSTTVYKIMVWVFILAFFLGGYVLENLGIQYVSEGGNPLLKIHFATYILIFSITLLTLKTGLRKPLANLEGFQSSWLISMSCIVLVIMYGLVRFGTSGMAYLVDTMVAPLLAIYLLSQLNTQQKNKLLRLLAYLLFINAVFAIVEFMLGKTMVTVEFSGFSHFRSTAFLMHPLNNALITCSLALILMRYTRIPFLVYFAVITLALFAFGGRAATGLFIVGVLIIFIPQIPLFIAKGIKVSRLRFAIIQALAFFVFIITTLIVALTPIGARILSKLHVDPSAQARFDVFIILEQLSLSEWFFGATKSLIDNIAFYIQIDVIENYIIGWIVSFGVICAFLLFISCFKLPIKLCMRGYSLTSRMTLMVFILVSLTNNALTSKTPALLFLTSVLYLFYTTREKENDSL